MVRIASSKSDLFLVHVGLRQGCPLSPGLFIIFMDRISSVLMAPSSQDLQHVLGWLAAECEAAGMTISTSKSEAMVLDWKKVACSLRVGGELLPQVEEFKYLGVLLTGGSVQRPHLWSWTLGHDRKNKIPDTSGQNEFPPQGGRALP